MKQHTKLICIVLLITCLGIATLRSIIHSVKKEPSSLSQLSILIADNPKVEKKSFNRYDAVIVSDWLLVEKYRRKSMSVPVFFLPEALDLSTFLQQPLKVKRNAIFTFGAVVTPGTMNTCKSLAKAFIQAFGERDDVVLTLYPSCTTPGFQKKLAKLAKKNIVVFKTEDTKNSEIAFYTTLDCYINVSFNQRLFGPPCKALSLGIPLITDHTDISFTSSSQVLSVGLNRHDNPNSLVQAMREISQHYDLFLDKAPQARNWVASFEKSHQQSLEAKRENLICPHKLIFEKHNLVDDTFLQTNSPQLYRKYLQLMPPPAQNRSNELVKYLRPLNPPKVPSGVEGIDCVYVINLDERPERWTAVKKQFDQQAITPYRVSAINGWKIPKNLAAQLCDENAYLFGGALGCLLSHVSVYKNALEEGFETVWICEDDIEFKQDAEKVSLLLKQLSELDPEWDVLYTDSCLRSDNLQHPRPGQALYTQVYTPINNDLVKIHGRFNTHSMIFSKRGLQKVYLHFTHGLLWAPIDVDIHYTPHLREYCARRNLVTSIYDSSLPAFDGSSDTQPLSSLNDL